MCNPSSTPQLALESITIFQSKEDIDAQLQHHAPLVEVVASRILEDGYELIIQGHPDDVSYIINYFGVEQEYPTYVSAPFSYN